MKIEGVLFVFIVFFTFSQAEEVEDETTIAPLPNIEYEDDSEIATMLPEVEPAEENKVPRQLDSTPMMSSPDVDDLVDNPEYEDVLEDDTDDEIEMTTIQPLVNDEMIEDNDVMTKDIVDKEETIDEAEPKAVNTMDDNEIEDTIEPRIIADEVKEERNLEPIEETVSEIKDESIIEDINNTIERLVDDEMDKDLEPTPEDLEPTPEDSMSEHKFKPYFYSYMTHHALPLYRQAPVAFVYNYLNHQKVSKMDVMENTVDVKSIEDNSAKPMHHQPYLGLYYIPYYG